MAKHIYDKDGEYKGKILSDEEHSKKQNADSGVPFWEASYSDDTKFIFKLFIFLILPIYIPTIVFGWKSYFISSNEFEIVDWIFIIAAVIAILGYFINKKDN